jgi:hypothetical protein
MVANVCENCGRRNLVTYTVEPREAWRFVVLDRWRALCPNCFDAQAELAGVRYHFLGMKAVSWSGKAKQPKQSGRKRR